MCWVCWFSNDELHMMLSILSVFEWENWRRNPSLGPWQPWNPKADMKSCHGLGHQKPWHLIPQLSTIIPLSFHPWNRSQYYPTTVNIRKPTWLIDWAGDPAYHSEHTYVNKYDWYIFVSWSPIFVQWLISSMECCSACILVSVFSCKSVIFLENRQPSGCFPINPRLVKAG